MRHYIGMAGLHGYLPQTCDVYDTAKDAAESLASLHDRGHRFAAKLAKDWYAELNLRRDGNEYCEIQDCDCDNPEQHSDSAL